MKTIHRRAVIAILTFAAFAFGAEADNAPEKLFLIQFTVGYSWVAGKAPGEQTGFGDHSKNLKRLRDEGRIVLGARYAETGLIVLRAASLESAREEIASDPGVKSGIFVFEAAELHPFYDGCLERKAKP